MTANIQTMTKIRFTGFADRLTRSSRPNDWQDIRLLRPPAACIWNSRPTRRYERIWGLWVCKPPYRRNAALVGDFISYRIWSLMGVRIGVGWVNDQFTSEPANDPSKNGWRWICRPPAFPRRHRHLPYFPWPRAGARVRSGRSHTRRSVPTLS